MLKKKKGFPPMILSRHPTHSPLRAANGLLPRLPFRSVVRFGSTTVLSDDNIRIPLNTPDAIKNSANKLLMKQCFTDDEVKTADWWTIEFINQAPGEEYCHHKFGEAKGESGVSLDNLPYPLVAKHIFGSRGRGNTKIDSQAQLQAWLPNKQLNNYIFEKFYNYSREYRLHVSEDGCFYTCRKMLKSDTPADQRWFRNDSNSVWIVEENEQFDKPVNWDEVIEESVKALKAVGLDFGAVDLRIQSAKNKDGKKIEKPDFIVVEINSAPSFGEKTLEHYTELIPKLLLRKYEKQQN
jgi:carbamoylphosphate synthase large subunit